MKTKEIKEQKLPNWFHGVLYKEGATVQNPFSGECCTLNNVELSMYDFVWGCSFIPNLSKEMVKNWRKGLDWFMKNNPKAYMVLLD
jgi:hypothetical protein